MSLRTRVELRFPNSLLLEYKCGCACVGSAVKVADSLTHHASFSEVFLFIYFFYGAFEWISVFIKWVVSRPLPVWSFLSLHPGEAGDMEFELALLERRHPEGESCSLGLSGGSGSDPGVLLQ